MHLVMSLGLLLSPLSPSDPKADAVVARAIEDLGGPAALDAVRELRVAWLGTQDLSAVYQSRFVERSAPVRRQETLVMDVPAHRGARRSEGVQSDDSPSLWLDMVLGDVGYSLNLKTRKVFRGSADSARARWEQWTWSVPHLALRELAARAGEVRYAGTESEDGRELDLLTYAVGKRPPMRILFDRSTGRLVGYAYEAPYVEGPTRFTYRFKAYRKAPGFGLFPGGYRLEIGGRAFRDMDVFDARLASAQDDPWLKDLPPETEPGSRIGEKPRRVERIAPNIAVLRNVGGYNALVASVGDCLAVVDAPASFSVDGPLPPADPPPDLAAQIVEMAAEAFPGKKICYVIPTHHHGDHFGGVPGLLRSGATLVTTPGNRELARRMAPQAPVEIVQGMKALGKGDDRIEIYTVPGTLHADEIVFAYFPVQRVAFEGDVGDYIPASKRFLQLVEERGLVIDKVYGVHTSTFWTLADAAQDDPSN